jgi:chaperonin GroES
MNFKPLGERVLVKAVEESNTTASGIIIPDNAKEKPNRAEVVAVSTEVQNINVGDTVVYGKYAGTELALEGTNYMVLEVSDILGVIA